MNSIILRRKTLDLLRSWDLRSPIKAQGGDGDSLGLYVDGKDIRSNEKIEKHADWVDELDLSTL